MGRVIAGYDGSHTSRAALAWAVHQAELHHAKLQVITVVDHRPTDQYADEVRARFHPDISRILGPMTVDYRVEHGDPASELVRECEKTDVLVVGSRGRGPLAEWLLGSVSHACLHAAPCPVVVVRQEPSQPHGVVLVGVDGSADSRLALTVAAEEARLRGATLHAIHAVHWDRVGTELMTPTVHELLGWGKHLLNQELTGAGVTAHPEVIHGSPSEILTRRSEHADLLVLGKLGHTPPANLLVGSTADHCARCARCPTMVTHEDPGD